MGQWIKGPSNSRVKRRPPLRDCTCGKNISFGSTLIPFYLQHELTQKDRYNQASHPLPFMKASNVIQPKKAAKEKPDIEEALEESDEGEVVEEATEEKPDAEDNDLSKDKYVKQPKKKKAPGAAKGKGKAGAKKGDAGEDDDDEGDDDGEEKPRKAPAKGKGRAKK